ncbi:hypothetical protein ABH926_001376 [Catenulispora sp. GP43]|uniref:hypothetical protein n=1 Tax=Catenulispora sp. GP43 TaxID=3156263 RepID=UPI003514FAF0
MTSKTRPLSVLLAAGALAVTTAGGAQAAAGWQAQPVPVASGNILALTSLTPHITWAAGFRVTPTAGKATILNPVVLSRDDRNGKGWQPVATPGDALRSRANAISAHSADDVWVVGDNDPGSADSYGKPIFTEHWDGRRWRTAPVPVPSDVFAADLLGISTLNQHDAWAVGTVEVVRGQEIVPDSIVEHWDGTAWQATKLPVDAAAAYLTSVTATGPDDVWAVGSLNAQPLALHFDGETWSRVPGLPAEPGGGELNQVLAEGPHDIWAAGDAGSASGPLVEHYDGRRWTRVAAPGAGEVFAIAETPSGIAFIGYTRADGTPYSEAFDGRKWTDLGLPARGVFDAPYAAVYGDGQLTVSGAYDTSDGAMNPLMIGSSLR